MSASSIKTEHIVLKRRDTAVSVKRSDVVNHLERSAKTSFAIEGSPTTDSQWSKIKKMAMF